MVPGGAVFSYDAMFSKGTVDMAGSPNEAADLSGEQTAGEFSKFRLSASVFQPLGGVMRFIPA
jgi:hemolysin activation/secretion protein